MMEVIGLGVPAGRQFGGERGVDEPGDGRGVGAAGVPLQGERHELRRLARLDFLRDLEVLPAPDAAGAGIVGAASLALP